jgi:hypothetical protein
MEIECCGNGTAHPDTELKPQAYCTEDSCRSGPDSASRCGQPQCNGNNGATPDSRAEGHGCCADKEKDNRSKNGGVVERTRGAGCGCKSASGRPDNPLNNADNVVAEPANQNGLTVGEEQSAESIGLCNGCPDKVASGLPVTDIIPIKQKTENMQMPDRNLSQDLDQGGSNQI